MKFVVATVCFVALATFAQEIIPFEEYHIYAVDILKAVFECKEIYNCLEEIIPVIQEFEVPKTTEGLNSLHCVGQKIGMISADNKIDINRLGEFAIRFGLHESHRDVVKRNCKSKITGSNDLEVTRSLMICIKNCIEQTKKGDLDYTSGSHRFIV